MIHALLYEFYQYWVDLVHLEASEYPRVWYTVKGLIVYPCCWYILFLGFIITIIIIIIIIIINWGLTWGILPCIAKELLHVIQQLLRNQQTCKWCPHHSYLYLIIISISHVKQIWNALSHEPYYSLWESAKFQKEPQIKSHCTTCLDLQSINLRNTLQLYGLMIYFS